MFWTVTLTLTVIADDEEGAEAEFREQALAGNFGHDQLEIEGET